MAVPKEHCQLRGCIDKVFIRRYSLDFRSYILGIQGITVENLISLMSQRIPHENSHLVRSRMLAYPYQNYHVFSETSLRRFYLPLLAQLRKVFKRALIFLIHDAGIQMQNRFIALNAATELTVFFRDGHTNIEVPYSPVDFCVPLRCGWDGRGGLALREEYGNHCHPQNPESRYIFPDGMALPCFPHLP